DSEMGRRTAHQVPVGRPGRGMTPAQLHMLIALPRVDSASDPGAPRWARPGRGAHRACAATGPFRWSRGAPRNADDLGDRLRSP
ncbi:hypothetical protein, partial [Nocardia abscessus]|uniref:hypothetical protein n=1 Tax=Nocardia abscessus TaxID=120957 RepID=UPI0024546593